VVAAVQAVPGKVVLLAGGLDKGMDFSALAEIAPKVRAVILYGQCREPIAGVFRSSGVPCIDCGTDFESAVETAIRQAETGDSVMLSPGCASMDMFKNYQERGDRFKELIRKKI
jgi:UDP-N-acetylmuramoylalanine--D-glutamate ligase